MSSKLSPEDRRLLAELSNVCDGVSSEVARARESLRRTQSIIPDLEFLMSKGIIPTNTKAINLASVLALGQKIWAPASILDKTKLPGYKEPPVAKSKQRR